MVWAFFYGFVTAFGVMAGFIFWAGRNTRPLLAARLLALENERKTTLAKAVKAAASVDKFKVSTIGAVTISATPAHIQTSGMQFRLTMIGSAITVTAVANAPNVNATASAATSAAAAKLLTADKVIATLNAKAIKVQRVNRNALLLLPAEGQDGLCEVDDRGLGETQERRVKWRALTLTFKGGAREAERWYSVLSPTPATQRWINFVQSVPQGCDSSLNFLVARILFENSGDSTLNTFIGAKIRKKLSHVKLPKPLSGSIELIDVSFGDEAPFFTNSAFSGSSSTGEFGFDFDLLYRGGFTVVLSATVDIGPLKIPNVILTVKILEIKGKMHMSIGAPPSKDMWLGFHQRPEIKINIHQDIHVPPEVEFLAASVRSIDLSSVVSDLVTMNLFDDMILPQMDDIPIPNVGPTPPSTPVVGPTAIKDPVLFEPALPPHAPAQPMLLSKRPAKPPSDLITRIISETESSAKPTSLAIRGAGNAAAPLPPPQPLPPAAPLEEPEVKAAAVNKAAEEAKRKTEAILQQSKASSVAAVEKKTPPVAATSPVEPTLAATTAPTPPPPVPPQRLSPQDDTWDYASDAEATKTTPHNQQSPAVVGQVPPAEVPAPAPVPAAPPQNQQPAAPQQPQPYVVDTSMYGRRYVQSQPQW